MSDDVGHSSALDLDRERESIDERQHDTNQRQPDTVSGNEDSEREYLQVTPGTDAADPEALHTACKQLHELGRRGTPPTIECLLTTPGDGTITYAFGNEDISLDRLTGVLRSAFPDSYNLTRTTDVWPAEFAPDETQMAAVTAYGRGDRRGDWQLPLDPVVTPDASTLDTLPMTSVVETLATAECPVAYQVLLEPKFDWRHEIDDRRVQLRERRDTVGQRLGAFITGRYETELPTKEELPPQTAKRLDALDNASPQYSFDVTVRAVGAGSDAQSTLSNLVPALRGASGEYYHVDPELATDESATTIATAIEERSTEVQTSIGSELLRRLPGLSNRRPQLVAGPESCPGFWAIAGDQLSPESRRALDVTLGERSGVPRPDQETLEQYRRSGMVLGLAQTAEGETVSQQLSLPPTLQPLHVAWFGKTGSGKSTSLVNAILSNHAATEGADILIDPKGDGMPEEYLRAHYAEYGTLDDVLYFDCSDVLPAITFFDIRDELDAGLDRTTAVEDVVDHYIELLIAIMGREQFHRAVRSPDIIRYLVKALFDPVHGDDAFSHRHLQQAARRMHETRDAPPVTDDDLAAMLGGVAANSKRSFDELMQGVANRIEKIPLDDRLGLLFNHVAEDPDPSFDFYEYLDEDTVIIIDTGDLRPESRRVITLVLLSNLWTALQRRTKTAGGDQPLVNLYLEEAASVATSGLMTELLAQSRGFGLSVTLAMQFPGQLRTSDHEAYAELLNNVSTIVTGNVAVDADLSRRLATDDMAAEAVGNRLRALERGQWMVSLPSEFGQPEPRPFVIESAPLPPGHPDGSHPLTEIEETAFETAVDALEDRTRREVGLAVTSARRPAASEATAGPTDDHDEDLSSTRTTPLDSALPYTERLPRPVKYDEERFALVCEECDSRYDRTISGMQNAIQCCHRLEDVDRDDVPICDVNLKLSPTECAQKDYSVRQLLFLQAVYTAHQLGFDEEWEFDIVWDSMIRLQEYVGIDQDAVQELIEDGLLRKDCTQPQTLYTVTPDGRDCIEVSHREGIAYGDGKGDLSESSVHVAMVELGYRYLIQEHVEADDSPVVTAKKYHEVDQQRLDLVGLDADGDIVIAVEAERSNNDTLRAAPHDFDKMAACNPEQAIWIVPVGTVAHDILDALNDPPEGDPRVEKTYSRNSPPQKFRIDQPGFTDVYTFRMLRKRLE